MFPNVPSVETKCSLIHTHPAPTASPGPAMGKWSSRARSLMNRKYKFTTN